MIDLSKVSACFITKDPLYPQEILRHISQFPFGEILILTNSDSPYRKYELFEKAKYELLYYQDDDAICPIEQLAVLSEPDIINVAMKPFHHDKYRYQRLTMGLGWGSIFPKKMLKSLYSYLMVYGEDELYKRETERILTYLNYPQNRFILPIKDLPSAFASDRLSMQPGHYENIPIVEERCDKIMSAWQVQ